MAAVCTNFFPCRRYLYFFLACFVLVIDMVCAFVLLRRRAFVMISLRVLENFGDEDGVDLTLLSGSPNVTGFAKSLPRIEPGSSF